jgi:hypothetical protein
VAFSQPARQVHQAALPTDHGQPVKRAAHTHKRSLAFLRQGQHVKTVSRNVVCG